MKTIILISIALLLLPTQCAAEDLLPTLFVERIGGAAFDVDESDPIYFGKVDPKARFENGSGAAVKAAISIIYLGYKNLTSTSRTSPDEVEYRTYSVGISVRAKDPRDEVAKLYYELSFGVGHSEVILNSGRADHNSMAEVQGSIGVVLPDRLSIGVGVSAQILGYPGETAASSASPHIAAGLWF